MQRNKHGRSFHSGKSLSKDIKSLIINELENNYGGTKHSMFIKRGGFSSTAEKYKVSVASVSNIWKEYCCGISTRSSGIVPRGRPKKLATADIDFIEYMKQQRPSYTSKHIQSELLTVSTTDVTPRTVRTAVRNYLSKPYTLKKIKPVARERITYENLVYTEAFMAILNQVDPHRLRFMDESGFRLPEIARPLYGHAPRGEKAVEIVRYHSSPNVTLHLLAGINGVGHCKVTNGASDSYTFVDFITECVNTVTDFGVCALRPGDILVVDNAAIHHSQIANVLKLWLERQGIDVVFTPRYSPDMNPVEECFSKIKSVLRAPCYGQLVQENLHFAIYNATKSITSGDMHKFFRNTGYIFC